ncbi:MAG: trypsin-like peptidase domain-containing protein [Clostridiales bacterium]|nr:trypsin-like peptidase domain-containing protein [Clostridiales bacterium]
MYEDDRDINNIWNERSADSAGEHIEAENQAPETAQYQYQESAQSYYSSQQSTGESNRMNRSYIPDEPKRGGSGDGKRSSLGAKVAGLTAAALFFGVVAGGTMFGVNTVGEYIRGQSSAVTETQAEPEVKVTVGAAETQPDTTVSSPSAQASTAVLYDVSEIVEKAMPSVVAINNTMLMQQQTWFGQSQTVEVPSSGSGIIVGQNDEELLIVTNNHVVEDSKELTITFIDDTQASAAIKGTDSDSDLAVVAVNLADIPAETMSQIKVATLGDSDELKVGQGVIAIGNALGYGQSVTVGYVSALNRTVETEDSSTRNLLQTDAAINPGNSGGALLNMRGEVIGINAAKYSSTSVEGMGYAIPISQAQDIINELMNKKTRVEVEEAKRGFLGIQGSNIDDTAAQMYGMPRGIYVYKILDDGAAASSELKEKDIITKFDGQTVRTMTDLQNMLTYYAGGDTVDLTVQRLDNGEYVEHTVTITLGYREETQTN